MINLSGLLKTAGAGYAGYGADKESMLKEALAARAAERQARQDAIDTALKQKTLRTPVLGDSAYLEAKRAEAGVGTDAAIATARGVAPIETQRALDVANGTAGVQRQTHAADRDYDNAHPAPVQASYSPVVTTTAGGDPHVSTLNTKTGQLADTGANAKAGSGSTVPASIRSKVAENESTLTTIADALASIEGHPDAVGLTRNIPLAGKYADQRLDPEGTATRALIANVGSLQIHTRTGANMNIREEPRLAPFVPDISDTPEALRTKLTQLAKFLKIENDALVGGGAPSAGGGRSAGPPAVAKPPITAAELQALVRMGKSEDAIRAKYTITP